MVANHDDDENNSTLSKTILKQGKEKLQTCIELLALRIKFNIFTKSFVHTSTFKESFGSFLRVRVGILPAAGPVLR
jgi:hypothetical protein